MARTAVGVSEHEAKSSVAYKKCTSDLLAAISVALWKGNAFALESVSAFDVYTGPGVPEGKKSLAFSLVFRSAERTLTDDEVNVVFQEVLDEIVKTSGWQVRK